MKKLLAIVLLAMGLFVLISITTVMVDKSRELGKEAALLEEKLSLLKDYKTKNLNLQKAINGFIEKTRQAENFEPKFIFKEIDKIDAEIMDLAFFCKQNLPELYPQIRGLRLDFNNLRDKALETAFLYRAETRFNDFLLSYFSLNKNRAVKSYFDLALFIDKNQPIREFLDIHAQSLINRLHNKAWLIFADKIIHQDHLEL